MKTEIVLALLLLSGCSTLTEYTCGGKIRCSDPDTALSRFALRLTGEDQRLQDEQDCATRDKTARNLTSQELAQVEASVLDTLKDPESARFKDIRRLSDYEQCMKWARRIPGNIYYTFEYHGLINSKNSYGGYVGYKEFWSNGKASIIFNK